MIRPAAISARSGSDEATVVQAVTVIMGVAIGLTFLYGFGNVLNLALRLGVPIGVAPLVAPVVDLSIPGSSSARGTWPWRRCCRRNCGQFAGC
jgi:hypothetical protein